MRRAWLRIGFLAAIFVAAVGLGFAVAARLAPERLRTHLEARLGQDLGRTVAIGALDLRLQAPEGLIVVLEDVEVGQTPGRLRARVPRAEVRIDPLPLLTGRLRIGRLELDRPHLRLAGSPAAGERPVPSDATGLASRVAEALGASLPFRWLGVHGGRVSWTGRPGEPAEVALTGVEAKLDARRLRLGRSARLTGTLALGEAQLPLELEVELRGESLRATGKLQRLPLEALAPLHRRLGLAAASGPVDLHVEWTHDGTTRVVTLLGGSGVVLRPRAAGGPTLRLDAPRLRAEAVRRAAGWDLSFAELVDGALRLRASGHLGASRARSPLALHLEMGALPLRGPGSLLARLPSAWSAPLEAALGPVEQGRLSAAVVDLDSRVGRLSALLRGETPEPGELHLALDVDDAIVRAGLDDRLTELSARLAWDGDRLDARDVRARFRGEPLPRLDLALRGLANVQGPGELRCIEPGPAPALPGLPRLVTWLDAQPRDADGAPSFEGVSVRADWLAHPTLVCSVEQVVARVVPAPGGLDVEVERAVFAGLPVEGRGAWRDGDGPAEASLQLSLAVGPPFEPMALTPPRSPWARGRFRAGLRRLGPWRLSGADGAFALEGATLSLRDVAVGLDPAGPARARVALDLGQASALPFEGAFALEDLDAREVARAGGIERPPLSGSLNGAGSVRGRLEIGRPLLGDATGTLVLHARDGLLHRRIPPLLAIATASGSLNPFAAGNQLRFDAVDLAGRLEGGRLRSEHFALVGPSVRMAAQGSLSATKPHDVQAVVGLFLFPGLDAMLDRVPLLGRVLLGPNGNFVGAYLSMDGPFRAPQARLIPIRSLATGPASLVFERIPGLLFGGLRALRGAIETAPEKPAPPPSRADS